MNKMLSPHGMTVSAVTEKALAAALLDHVTWMHSNARREMLLKEKR